MTRSDDYLWDKSGDVDPDVARLEELMAPLRHRAPLDELRLRKRARWVPILGIVVAVAAVLAIVVVWPRAGTSACSGGTGFKLTAKGGTVACGGAAVASGELAVGTVLDTGSNEAVVTYASPTQPNIRANLDFGAKTRVRLAHTSGDRHELFLEQGHMHAFVSAPPRIFAVATPSAQVTDLGCEYTLDIDATGAGTIHVITGQVELETSTHQIVVAPRGMYARLLPGRRAGLPTAERASKELVLAVYDFENGNAAALPHILASATVGDAMTIANLVLLVPDDQKRVVMEKLAELVPPPQATTIQEALDEPVLFDMWFTEVQLVHVGASTVPAKTP